jgi:hypothetical protein
VQEYQPPTLDEQNKTLLAALEQVETYLTNIGRGKKILPAIRETITSAGGVIYGSPGWRQRQREQKAAARAAKNLEKSTRQKPRTPSAPPKPTEEQP